MELKFSAFLSCVAVTKCVKFQIPRYKGFKIGIFRISPIYGPMWVSRNNRNNLRVRLSKIKSPVLRKYLNPFKRPSMYPSISKCNAKSCNCCQHLCTNTTITSSVNGRTFSVINNSDLD